MKNLYHQRGSLNYQTYQASRKKEFAAIALNPEHNIFTVYVASISFTPLNADVYLPYRPQIWGLIVEETPMDILDKYVNFADIFFRDLAFKLPEYTGINDYAIELVDDQQLSYGPINS